MKVVKGLKSLVLIGLLVMAIVPAAEAKIAKTGIFDFESVGEPVAPDNSLGKKMTTEDVTPTKVHLDLDRATFVGVDGWIGLDSTDMVTLDSADLIGNENSPKNKLGATIKNITGKFNLTAYFEDDAKNKLDLGNGTLIDASAPGVVWNWNLDADALKMLENQINSNKGIDVFLSLSLCPGSSTGGSVYLSDVHLPGEGHLASNVVPEPLSLFLLGSSLAGFGAWKKKELFSSND